MLNITFTVLDVHARTVSTAALKRSSGEIIEEKLAADKMSVVTWATGFDDNVQETYDAGLSGYGLVRHSTGRDIACVLAAPLEVITGPGDHLRTDPREARGVARMLSLGEVSAVRVHTVEQDVLQDVLRARQRAVGDLSYARLRSDAILFRQELYQGEKARQKVHHAWLASQRLEPLTSRIIFAAELEAEATLMAHL